MLSIALVAVTSCLAASGLASGEPQAPTLVAEHYRLKNGLTVVLSRDERLPTVAVELRYLVGSAHEEAGKTGFAHLFEHLMFNGSKNHPGEYFAPFEPVGARVNGTTNVDRTNYFERLPHTHLELALWMESDRMRSLLPALTQENLDNQRDVVKNERRMRYENRPYGRARMVILENLFPSGHPYHHPTIGSHEDLEAASLEDVRTFFERYYAPSNAVITVVGDFEPKQTKRWIKEYFGDIPAGMRAPAPSFPEAVKEPPMSPVVVEDRVAHDRLYLAWRTPPLYAPGDAALDIASTVLASGASSRLERSLVHEKKLAKDVSAYQASNLGPSYFVIQATAAPGVSLDDLRAALRGSIADSLKRQTSGPEFAEALAGWEKSFFQRTESPLNRALMLSGYYHATGSPEYFSQDLERYLELEPKDVDAALRRYLKPGEALEVHFIPFESDKDLASPAMAPGT